MLGALNIANHRYVLPKDAVKGEKYKCAETGVPLLLCKGKVRVPYFRTYPTHTGEPGAPHKGIQNGESIEHKNAKHIVSYFLGQGGHVPIERSCICCKAGGRYEKIGYTGHFIIEFRGVQDVMEEMPCENGRADIGFTNYDGEKWLVEILHTHATNHREGNWVELVASQVIEAWEAKNGFFLSCVRPFKCDECADRDEKVRLEEMRLAEIRQKEQERIRLDVEKARKEHERRSKLVDALTKFYRRRRLEKQEKQKLAVLKSYKEEQEFERRQRIAEQNILRMRQEEAERIRKEKWDAEAPLRAERREWDKMKDEYIKQIRAHQKSYVVSRTKGTPHTIVHPDKDPKFVNFLPYNRP